MSFARLEGLKFAVAHAIRYDSSVRSRQFLHDYIEDDKNFGVLRDELQHRWSPEEAQAFSSWYCDFRSFQRPPPPRIDGIDAFPQNKLALAVNYLGLMFVYSGWQALYLVYLDRLFAASTPYDLEVARADLNIEVSAFQDTHPLQVARYQYNWHGELMVIMDDPVPWGAEFLAEVLARVPEELL
ncbi:hypothetical protein K523DRAFT_421973 [Schizophyllum commune Tattone D]|nr:hypothetical protein K523DRAFT_421973 [Schizophyllum commune Tattone D]